MGGTRALIASLGASISLVAGAALSLLVVSFVFAYDGLSGSPDTPTTQAAVLVDVRTAPPSAARTARTTTAARPVVVSARRAPARTTSRPAAEAREAAGPRQPSGAARETDLRPVDTPAASSQPAGRAPAAGDGVRDLGDAVSSTVGETGEAAGAATAPLGPPVGEAVQKVLDLLDGLLTGTTGTLAGTVDKLP